MQCLGRTGEERGTDTAQWLGGRGERNRDIAVFRRERRGERNRDRSKGSGRDVCRVVTMA